MCTMAINRTPPLYGVDFTVVNPFVALHKMSLLHKKSMSCTKSLTCKMERRRDNRAAVDLTANHFH